MDLYHDVYQLQRLPGKINCDEEMEAHIYQEILDSVKEHLWHKQLSAFLGKEPRQSPAGIPRLTSQAEFSTKTMPLIIGSWMLSDTPVRKLWP